MILPIPLAVLFGILTIISLFITFILGIAMHRYGKPVFKQHKFFAFLTIILAIIHSTFAILLWLFRIAI